MSIELATEFWTVAALYLATGAVVAAPIAFWGTSATDHAARGAGVAFRLIIMPGIIALWPYFILRMLSGRIVNKPIDEAGRE